VVLPELAEHVAHRHREGGARDARVEILDAQCGVARRGVARVADGVGNFEDEAIAEALTVGALAAELRKENTKGFWKLAESGRRSRIGEIKRRDGFAQLADLKL